MFFYENPNRSSDVFKYVQEYMEICSSNAKEEFI